MFRLSKFAYVFVPVSQGTMKRNQLDDEYSTELRTLAVITRIANEIWWIRSRKDNLENIIIVKKSMNTLLHLNSN